MNLDDDRLAPYHPIHSSTYELLKQTGETQLSCCLLPVFDGSTNPYLTYYTHLTSHGIVFEIKIDEQKYELEKKLRGFLNFGMALSGMSNSFYRGMSAGRKQIREKNWSQAKEIENNVFVILYKDIEKFQLVTEKFFIDLEFHLKTKDILSFQIDYIPDRSPRFGIMNRMTIAESFFKKASYLKEESRRIEQQQQQQQQQQASSSSSSKNSLLSWLALGSLTIIPVLSFYNWKINLILVPIIFILVARNLNKT